MSPPGGAILWPGKSSKAFEVKDQLPAAHTGRWHLWDLWPWAHTHPTPPPGSTEGSPTHSSFPQSAWRRIHLLPGQPG